MFYFDSLVHLRDRVKLAMVPHIEGLRIPEILEFARDHFDVDKYMVEY